MKAMKLQLLNPANVMLRYPENADSDEFIRQAIGSAELHKGTVSPPDDQNSFDEYLERNRSDANECLLIIERNSDAIAGAVNLSQIFFKGFCSAYLGYYLFNGFTGRGLMTSAIEVLLRHSFTEMGLHRIEANIRPENVDSIKVVKRCGFVKEGFSRKYLMVAGDWRDHERWAIIKEEWESRIIDE